MIGWIKWVDLESNVKWMELGQRVVGKAGLIMEQEQRCGNCVFALKSDDLELPGGEGLRCCRRRTEREADMWPETAGGRWCGEWEGRNGEKRL